MNTPDYINPAHPDHDMGELLQTGFSTTIHAVPDPRVVEDLLSFFRHPRAVAILLKWLGAIQESDSLPSLTSEEHVTTLGARTTEKQMSILQALAHEAGIFFEEES